MLKRLFLSALILAAAALPGRAFETSARAAWVYDLTTQTVLLDKNADMPIPPASMSKLMTLNMLFEALERGQVTMDTTFGVSEKAWKMGGSKMFVKPGDRPTVEDLIHGIIINSGNDACVVVAEGLAGTEEAFAQQMTQRAQQLGMTNSRFANSSGWPDPGHMMSARDLGLIAVRLITEFPDLYPFFGMTGFNYEGRVPANGNNRNPLLRAGGDGDWTADGLKTGHTEEAGYGLVGSAIEPRSGRRIVMVLSGLGSESARAQESEAVTNWAFRQFALRTLVKGATRLAEAEVHMGAVPTVGLVVERDLSVLMPALAQDGVTAEAVYSGPINAPIAAGQTLGELVVTVPEMPEMRLPLLAETEVPTGGFTKRLGVAAGDLVARVAGPAS
ncbi:D-alanyl-D-alanine carboxypeptidase family protein [Frigidibacter oleivorans]|uniref:D-alanyl-D-alanine carboxypeptidase family protein n=1 Tax=Frigidibacter oleivorans TaxID=2487129 RepID=UPI000F8CC365|nr:D-alanyl-D-alanine carboxypeptidase family protein [Frigidibacter oleivorans]